MARPLSSEAKQTFQVVALLSTILVVLIHYQSAAPRLPDPGAATWNELTQEFLLGGLARVAVPIFAFAAGLFYFRSDDGSRRCYIRKLSVRCRTIAFPYFLVASVATASWLLVRRIEGDPVLLTVGQFIATWWLGPPAEQLWFLRDLLILVALAPLIRIVINRSPAIFLAALGMIWTAQWQPFPTVAGWHLMQPETILFFSLGGVAAAHPTWIEKLARLDGRFVAGLSLIWVDLVVTRILMRADFDVWYRDDYELSSLIVHKISILVGCVALFAISSKCRSPFLIKASGFSFFVYLVHEFPLRAAIERIAERVIEPTVWFWLTGPAALTICFAFARLVHRHSPTLYAVATGGRSPERAARVSMPHGSAMSRASTNSMGGPGR